MNIENGSIKDIRKALDSKEISVKELTDKYYQRIEKYDSSYDCFITLSKEKAYEQAKIAQEKIDNNNASFLTGIPFAIKDNICTDGVLTTCASKMLEGFVPPYNATVIDRLEAQGIVMLGKVSMDEFAMGGSTQTAYQKKTKNPYDNERVPGGSSGGSASSVAADFCVAALGSDTGGSIRQPASFCGVTGFKPTYSRVSRYGLIAFASSLDQIGPVAKNAYDCGEILNAISGFDIHDGTSAKKDVPDFNAKINDDIKGLKVAIPKEFFADGIDEEIKKTVLKAVDDYKAMGAEIIECSMPSLKYAIPAYYLISSAEAASNLSRFDGIKYGHRTDRKVENFEQLIRFSRGEGFGDEVKRRILLGNYALSSGYYDAYYGKAMALRQKIRQEYNDIFKLADIIITPTTPSTAYRIDENISDPVSMYQADICTVTVNIAGLPAISTPCGYDSKGLPIGMSIIGKQFDEQTVLQTANAFEKNFTRVLPTIK